MSTLLSPHPLTASSLAIFARQSARSLSPDRLTLSGDTPTPTAPPSIDGDTECGSRPQSPELKKGKEDIEAVELAVLDDSPVPNHYPEGGLRAYCAVAGGALLLVSTFALSNSFGVFLQEYQKHQLADYPASTITWIGSTQLFLVFGTSLVSGMAFDRGYFQAQLALGSILWIAGMFSLSVSKTFGQIFLSQSICMGLGLGVMFGPVLSCVGTYFLKRRAFMIGICASGGALGAITFPILLNNFFVSHGFAASVRIAAYIMTGLLVIVNLLMRPRQLPPKARTRVGPLLHNLLREPSMWLGCTGIFGGVIGLFIVMFYIQVFVRTHGASQVLATYALSILNAAAFFGRISVGVIADRVGIFNTCIPFTFVMAVTTFAMYVSSFTLLIAQLLTSQPPTGSAPQQPAARSRSSSSSASRAAVSSPSWPPAS